MVWILLHAQLLSHVWLFATPWTVAHQNPLLMESAWQEYWSGLPFPPPGYLPDPRTTPLSPGAAAFAQSLQSCLTLRDPIDSSPPVSSLHGILQARILEWVARPSSRESSQPRDRTHVCLHLLLCRWILSHWATWEACWVFIPPFKFMSNS